MTDERRKKNEGDTADRGSDRSRIDNVSKPPFDGGPTRAPFDKGPARQLRRTGTKIGRKVLPFERLVFRLGPLRVYRGAEGGFSVRWQFRRSRKR